MKHSIRPSKSNYAECRAGHCHWCGQLFTIARRRGSLRKFCSPLHRHAYASSARAWGIIAHEMGLLTIEDLKDSERSVRAFLERLEGMGK